MECVQYAKQECVCVCVVKIIMMDGHAGMFMCVLLCYVLCLSPAFFSTSVFTVQIIDQM